MAASPIICFLRAADSDNTPLSGAKANIYAAGTTTPLSLFSNTGLSVAAANPIVADSAGLFPIRYFSPVAYKIATTTSADVAVSNLSWDNIDPGVPITSGALPVASGGTGATTAGGARTNLGAAAESTVTSLATDVATIDTDLTTLTTTVDSLPWGQGRLAKNGASLLLSPQDGNRLTINSQTETIPDAGVSLAVGALGNTTLYYVYAYMSAGTMTLEAVTTAYATQAGTGLKIKSGDATRTLVGMCYLSGGAFVDSATQRFTRSYFCDPGIALSNVHTADRTVSSATFAETNSEIRNEFLTWSGEIVQVIANGALVSASDVGFVSIAFNGATAEDTANRYDSTSVDGGFSVALFKTGLTEGYNYSTLVAKVASGSIVVGGSATTGTRSSVKTMTRRN